MYPLHVTRAFTFGSVLTLIGPVDKALLQLGCSYSVCKLAVQNVRLGFLERLSSIIQPACLMGMPYMQAEEGREGADQ